MSINASRIFRTVFFCMPGTDGRWGRPIILWGPPGLGKTAVAGTSSRGHGFHYMRLSAAERGEGQFGVVPVPGADGYLQYPAPVWAKELDGKSSVILVDEMGSVPPALAAPLLGFVQFGILGTHQFDSRVRIIGAANEARDAAGGWDLAPALANRFGHIDFTELLGDSRAKSWAHWLLVDRVSGRDVQVAAVDARAEEERVATLWPAAEGRASGLFAGFIQARPANLHRQPNPGDPQASRAWPSPRTNEYAMSILASAEVQGCTEEETDMLMAAFIGSPATREFVTWRREADLPNIEDWLDGRVAFKHNTDRLDRTIAVLSAGAGVVVPAKAERRKERAGALWTFIGKVIDHDADVTIPAARMMMVKGLGAVPEARPILGKIQPILAAAGITTAGD